jgi:hypothetical protein
MTPLFSRKKKGREDEQTILILDVENGSAASALVRISENGQPKMFGEIRTHTTLPMKRDAHKLSSDVEEAVETVLQHASEVAARVRNHPATFALGDIDSVVVFLAPPWGAPNLAEGKPAFLEGMKGFVKNALGRTVGETPTSFYTSAGSAAFATRALMSKEPCLVCSVTGEVSELMRMDEQGVVAHATFPSGLHSYLRTLRTHGGLSESEARSAVRLPHNEGRLREPSEVAAREFATHFKEAAREIMDDTPLIRVALIAPEHVSERLARALTEDASLQELFPQGGEVRPLRAHHATAHIAAHTESPDLHLLLGALFADHHSKF